MKIIKIALSFTLFQLQLYNVMKAFEIKSTDKEILIRLDKTELSTSDLTNIVNRLRLEVLAQKSSLTPNQAQRLADEVDDAWWEQHGKSFLKDIKP